MVAISAVISFHQNSQVIKRFHSRISYCDELDSVNNFKRHVESFLDYCRDFGKVARVASVPVRSDRNSGYQQDPIDLASADNEQSI